MTHTATRRRFLQGTAAIGAIGAAGCLGDADDGTDYEVWALDQGTQHLHILTPNDEGDVEASESIDLFAQDDGIETPHMIDFTSDYEYAVIASTAGGTTSFVRTDDREVVEVLDTGAASHFAGITPDDDTVIVDVIGDEKIVEIDADFDAEEFSIERELSLADDETFQNGGYSSNSPVCHDYSHDGSKAYVTIGPGFGDAGLAVLDVENMEISKTYDPEEVQTNCGTIAHPDEDLLFLNGGGGPDNPSPWYVVDMDTDEVIHEDDTGGDGAHAVWFTPDAEELWMLNRVSNDGIVIDPDSFEVIDEIEEVGPAGAGDPDDVPYDLENPPENPGDKPDILTISPDGELAFSTLRGPNPKSAGGVSVGENPGIAVLDVESRERVDLIQPADDLEASDFHGIGLRLVD